MKCIDKVFYVFNVRRSLLVFFVFFVFFVGGAYAQQALDIDKLIESGHYLAAQQSLTTGVGTQEQALICDYYLQGDKLLGEKDTNLSNRLKAMKACLLTKKGDYDAALQLFHVTQVDALSDSERETTVVNHAISLIETSGGAKATSEGKADLQKAEKLLRSVSNSQEHQTDITFYTGYIKYSEGKFLESMPYFEEVAGSSAYQGTAPVYIGDCYLKQGNSQTALTEVMTAINSDAGLNIKIAPDAYRVMGEAYYDLGQYNDAIKYLSRCSETLDRTGLYKLGMSNFHIHEYTSAASALSQSAGTATDVMAQSAWLNAGISYINASAGSQARIAFQQAANINADPGIEEEALYNYALCLHQGSTMGFGEAVTTFERFLNTFPQSKYAPQISQHLTEVYFTTRNYPAALESINKIKNPGREILTAKQQVLYNLGVQTFTAGDFTAAADYMGQAVNLGSYDTDIRSEAYYWKGEAEYRLGKYSASAEDMKRYLKTHPASGTNSNNALYTLGYCNFKQKKYDSATTSFRQLLKNLQSQESVAANSALKSQNAQLTKDVANRLADCLYTAENFDEAYSIYGMAGDSYAICQQGLIEGLRGNYDRKIALLDSVRYLPSTPETMQADIIYEQARAYAQIGDQEDAFRSFQLLVNKYPNSTGARRAGREIGDIYLASGDKAAAIEAYRKVIETYPYTTEAKAALFSLKGLYTDMGLVNEYTALAEKAGHVVGWEEMDDMTLTAAVKAYDEGDYASAFSYYDQLSQQTLSAETQLLAMEGRLRSSFGSKDYKNAILIATVMLADNKTSPEHLTEAQLLKGESYLANGDTINALIELNQAILDDKTEYGAQAVVRLAQYYYDTADYQQADSLLQDFVGSGTSHYYWLARGFILLSDVYAQTGRKVEAREYLLSLKTNYTESEEITKMINERLRRL